MGHNTHAHDTHHNKDNKPGSSFTSAFWLIIILAGLFIAAVNFVNVMGHDEGGHDGGHEATEHTDPSAGHGNIQHQEVAPNHGDSHHEEVNGPVEEATAPKEEEHHEEGHH